MTRRIAGSKASRGVAGRLIVALIVVLATLLGDAAVRAQVNTEALGSRVDDFLEQWLEQRDPFSAVDVHLSSTLNDLLLPVLPGDVRGYVAQPAEAVRSAAEVSRGEAVVRMMDFISGIFSGNERSGFIETPVRIGSLEDDTDQDLVAALQSIDAERVVGILPGQSRLRYFQVNDWDDIAWTYSDVPGHRAISRDFLAVEGIDRLFALVGLLTMSQETVPLVMLWAEVQGDNEGWKLWGVIPVPTE